MAAADILPPNYQALEILEKDAPTEGFEITVLEDTWQLDATDLTPQINKIYAAYKEHNPDVLFVMSAIVQTPIFSKGLMDLGVTVPIQSGPVSGHPAIFSMGPEVVEGLLLHRGGHHQSLANCPMTIPSKAVMLDFADSLPGQVQRACHSLRGSRLRQLPHPSSRV